MKTKIAPKELWYGSCSYWTDDWDKLNVPDGQIEVTGPGGVKTKVRTGVPLCPVCGAPGFVAPVDEWMKGAQRFEDEGHPRYVEFLNANKETCLPRGFLTSYKMWIASQPVTG